jgi:isochorismate hydrolase
MTTQSPPASSDKCSVKSSQLLIIDIQQRLGQAMPAKVLRRVVSNSVLLARSADLLGVPVLRTEQYPRGLGPTVAEITEALPGTTQSFEKTSFSGVAAAGFLEALAQTDRQQVIIVGMEAHVCVLQTALDLLAGNYNVYVAEDAVCSRRLENYQNAIDRLRQSKVNIVSAESVIFEWLVDAQHEQFKAIQALLR